MNIVINRWFSVSPVPLDRPSEGLLVLCGEELFCEGCFLEEVPVLFGCLGRASSSCVWVMERGEERLGELVMASAGSASLSEPEEKRVSR